MRRSRHPLLLLLERLQADPKFAQTTTELLSEAFAYTDALQETMADVMAMALEVPRGATDVNRAKLAHALEKWLADLRSNPSSFSRERAVKVAALAVALQTESAMRSFAETASPSSPPDTGETGTSSPETTGSTTPT